MDKTGLLFHYRIHLTAAVGLVVILAGGWYLMGDDAATPQADQWRRGWDAPAVVRAQPAVVENLEVQVKSIGTVTPLNSVTVRSRVNGVLERIVVEEGASVEQGDLLAEIDPLPYEAQLGQAEGQLQQNKAKLENARADLALYETLWEQDSIARQQLSDQRALVAELGGTVRANEAQVDDARLQLSWTRIEAPISGKLGLRRIDQGNLVNSSDADGLVTITQMQPIAVNFTVSERDVPALRRAFDGGSALQVEVLDRSEQEVLATGELTTLDNQIDTTTGTLRVRARFENSDYSLFPNQFVNVRLRLKTLESVLTVPSDAIQYGADRTYVYVIEDGKSYVREVSLGATNEVVEITAGLNPGDMVVLEGLDRLRDGKDVIIPAMDAASDTLIDEPRTERGVVADPQNAIPGKADSGENRPASRDPS